MPKRRVVVVSPSAGNAGGVERFCHLLAQVVQANGWDATVIDARAAAPVSRAARAGLQPFMTARALATGLAPPPDLIVTNGHLGATNAWPSPRLHVVHDVTPARARYLDRGTSYRFRARYVLSHTLAEAASLRRARVVCVAASCARDLERFYRRQADEVIPNGVDVSHFAPGDKYKARERLGLADVETPIGLFVGRPEYRKGADLVVPACRRAGWTPVIAGGSLRGALELGQLTPSLLVTALHAADAVVFPTRYEACSFAVLETLAAGVPLVTTPVGEMARIGAAVPALQRLLCQPHVDSVAQALERVDGIRTEAALEGRAHIVKNYSLDKFAERWTAAVGPMLSG